MGAVDPAAVDLVVASWFGVPRDLIRRYDELIAMDSRGEASAANFFQEQRRVLIDLAVSTFGRPHPKPGPSNHDDMAAARHISRLLHTSEDLRSPERLSEARALILIWICHCLGVAVSIGLIARV